MPTVNPDHLRALMALLDRSPYFALLDMHFEEMAEASCRLTVPYDFSRHGNAFGGAHGGGYASLIDTVAYWALYCGMEATQGYTSLDLSVTNLGVIQSGTLIAEGRVIRKGRSICLGEGTVKNEAGKLLAHGVSKLMLLEGRQSIDVLLASAGLVALPPKFLSGESE